MLLRPGLLHRWRPLVEATGVVRRLGGVDATRGWIYGGVRGAQSGSSINDTLFLKEDFEEEYAQRVWRRYPTYSCSHSSSAWLQGIRPAYRSYWMVEWREAAAHPRQLASYTAEARRRPPWTRITHRTASGAS
jgi:hypothetical protein